MYEDQYGFSTSISEVKGVMKTKHLMCGLAEKEKGLESLDNDLVSCTFFIVATCNWCFQGG